MYDERIDYEGPPETNYECKKVLLRAERGDTIDVDEFGRCTVRTRKTRYYGPELRLTPESAEETDTTTLLMFGSGPDSQLRVMRAVTDEDGFILGWEDCGETTAELVDTKQYDICSTCGEPIKNGEHARQSLLGICEFDSD